MLEETTPPYGERTQDPGRTESGSEIKETLEDATRRVREKVSDATGEVRDKVSHAAQNVREQVEGAAEQVRGFDLQQQVRAHPWMALGVAAVAGYVFGSMGDSRRRGDTDRYSDFDDDAQQRYGANGYGKRSKQHERRESNGSMSDSDSYAQHWSPAATHSANPALGATYGGRPHFAQPGFAQPTAYGQSMEGRGIAQRSQMWDQVRDQFGEELRTLMTAAVGTVISLVRDTATEHVPQFAEEYERRRREDDAQANRPGTQHAWSGAQSSTTGASVHEREQPFGVGRSGHQAGAAHELGAPRTGSEPTL